VDQLLQIGRRPDAGNQNEQADRQDDRPPVGQSDYTGRALNQQKVEHDDFDESAETFLPDCK